MNLLFSCRPSTSTRSRKNQIHINNTLEVQMACNFSLNRYFQASVCKVSKMLLELWQSVTMNTKKMLQ